MTTKTAPRPQMREKTSLSTNLDCPYCHRPQRTQGWLTWHIEKYHAKERSKNSPAGAGVSLLEFRRRYTSCEICGCQLYMVLHPELVGWFEYTPEGVNAICRDCVDKEGLVRVKQKEEASKV